jgi:hypothetical protein
MAYDLLAKGAKGDDLRNTLNAIIGDFDLAESRRFWKGKKMVTFGDSIWPTNVIQPELIRLLGVTYSLAECRDGIDGGWPMFLSGTGVGSSVGENKDAFYYRADDVPDHNADLFICEGGINDTLGGVMGPTSYTHTDAVYTGNDIAGDSPSYVSVLKGFFRKLIVNNPDMFIVFMGRYTYEQSEPSADNMARIMARQAADEYCCRWAGVTYVDPLTFGIGFMNTANFMSSSAHPNTAGAALIARAFARACSLV